jgi:hypothetical protein
MYTIHVLMYARRLLDLRFVVVNSNLSRVNDF